MECELGDITVNYQMVGSGKPLLFLHGSVGDHQPWLQTLEPLFDHRQGWKRIYLDLPGHGPTQAPDWLTTDDQVLDVLLRFIDRVIPSERFVVAGFSWGGYLAQGIVYQRISEVDGLLLIAPGTHRDDEKNPERTVLVKNEELLTELDELLKELATGVLVMQNRRTIDRLQTLSQSFRSIIQDDPDFAARLKQGFSFDMDNLPRPYDKPVLFLLGRQDHIVGYRNAWQILENFPRATFAVLDQA
ncbi:MAG TPA: alpha/beta hydrolase, partial [Anaerolineales bacterium]|nr:alpha/beta hydrolase [Anaerolineales bacterium]